MSVKPDSNVKQAGCTFYNIVIRLMEGNSHNILQHTKYRVAFESYKESGLAVIKLGFVSIVKLLLVA